jgi:deoxyhypusine synthase
MDPVILEARFNCFLCLYNESVYPCMQNVWTPSKVIARLGKEINDESSYLYWAYKVSCLLYYLCIVRSQKRTAEMGT